MNTQPLYEMKTLLLKSLLKVSKSPAKIYSIVSELTPLVIPSTLVSTIPSDYDEIEKKLLLSSFLLDFSTRKDVRSDFILEYVTAFKDDVFKSHDAEYVIYLFENAASGFGFGSGGTDQERRMWAEEELVDYIYVRLITYRYFIEEYVDGNTQDMKAFFFLLGYKSFFPGNWYLNPGRGYLQFDLDECTDFAEETYAYFLKVVGELAKKYMNVVKAPKTTWMNSNPETERYHTEGLLATLRISKATPYLSFESISGVGVVHCKHCGFSKEIVSFVHGAMSATIGRQCPQCGEFCEEHNESKEYHKFGESVEDFVCPKCHYVIRKKEESIFKGQENPLFCPKCHSVDLEYRTTYLT